MGDKAHRLCKKAVCYTDVVDKNNKRKENTGPGRKTEMEIKYYFVTGEVVTVDVNEKLGTYINNSKKVEDSYTRKSLRHNYSLDAIVYEAKEYGSCDTYFSKEAWAEEQKRIQEIRALMTDVQLSRIDKRMQGMNLHQIAQEEHVSVQSVSESFLSAQKKIKRFFQKHPDKRRKNVRNMRGE